MMILHKRKSSLSNVKKYTNAHNMSTNIKCGQLQYMEALFNQVITKTHPCNMQHFKGCKNDIFYENIFLIFAQNID